MAKDFKQRIINGLNTVQTAVLQQQHLGPSAFFPATLDQMACVKSGWLRKPGSGGTVRSWQRRWFVLKGDYLCCYMSEEDCTNGRQPLGSIFLPGNHVFEVPYNPSDSEKYQFEINPGDSDIIGTSNEKHVMSAENEDERKDWLLVFKQILYQRNGGAIFGQPLDITLQFEQKRRDKTRKVPEIVECCVEYLRKVGLTEEGLFRLPGRTVLVRQLSEMYDRGDRPTFLPDQAGSIDVDVHSIASLLKSYLRELPQPLIPFDAYERVMHLITREKELIGEERTVEAMSRIMNSTLVPPAYYNTLQYLSRFLAQVASHSNVNKMSAQNLSTVFVQSFIRPEADDPSLMLATAPQRTVATQVIISHQEEIFTTEYTHDGNKVLVGDLLGLDCAAEDHNSSIPSSHSFNSDLAGLDLNLSSSVIDRCKDFDTSGSVENTVSTTGELDELAAVSCVVLRHGSVDDGDATDENAMVENGDRNANRRARLGARTASLSQIAVSSNQPEVHPRFATVRLKDKSKRRAAIIEHVRPPLRPKPINPHVPAAVDANSRSSSEGHVSEGHVTDEDLRSQVQRLETKLKSVERERDAANEKVRELEQLLKVYQGSP